MNCCGGSPHPFWFQSFGAVMGMDWHSSGITTSVIGALKRGLTPLQKRARHPRLRRPRQAFAADAARARGIGDSVGFDGAALAAASRLVAKVDSAAVQDGFDLYLHGFIVTDDGKWTVVQQGMNGDTQAGAPLSLAFGRIEEFRRRSACCDRRDRAGRDHQSRRPSGREVAPSATRSLSSLGPDKIAAEFAKLESRDVVPTAAGPIVVASPDHAVAS